MKQLLNPLFSLALVGSAFMLLSGCSDHCTEQTEVPVSVHLQSIFDNDHVQVAIDGRNVFDGYASTNHLLGVAEIIDLSVTPGRHTVDVVVNGRGVRSGTFDAEATPWVLAGYHEGVVGLHFSDERPIYD